MLDLSLFRNNTGSGQSSMFNLCVLSKGENSIFRRMTEVITERNDTEPVILSMTENGWYQE